MRYDVVVIGSGFGGSISAHHLARAGAKVLVIERGPWRDTLPVRSLGIADRAPLPQGLRLLTHGLRTIRAPFLPTGGWTLNCRGMYEMFQFPGIDVVCTSGVGGGSHAYAGLLSKPASERYWQGRHPELDPAEIEQHYATVLADLNATPLTESSHANTVWSQLSTLPADSFKPSVDQPHVGILFPPQSPPATAGVEREPCRFDGDSFLGSKDGAKSTVDFIYLAPAMRAGADLRELCEVRRILRGVEDGARYTVEFRDLRTQAVERVHADQVVLAAGTMNTLSLLFRSSEPGDGSLQRMPALGRTFGGNTDLVGAWHRPASELSSFDAPPCLGRFMYREENAPYFVLGAFPGVDSLPLPWFVKNRLRRTVAVIGMAADSGKASVCYQRDRLRVDYDTSGETVFKEVRQVFKALAKASGSKVGARRKPATVHPWGGACVGENQDTGVVDHRGEVHGNSGLFIADGSILPAAAGAPPTLAIAAWAHYLSSQLAKTLASR
jgi:cholesterol oxidase